MNRITILCNGAYPQSPQATNALYRSDILICCDGAFGKVLEDSQAAEMLRSLEFYITGDLDSLSTDLKERYSGHIIRYDDQNINDQTKAFILASRIVEERYDTEPFAVTFIGATGLREDHTVANMGLLMDYAIKDVCTQGKCTLEMLTDYCRIIPAIGTVLEISCRKGDAISVFSPDPGLNVVSDGLNWQTDGVRFSNWWQASLNRATKERVTLRLSHPSRLIATVSAVAPSGAI